MAARLVWLQLVQGAHFKALADENRIRLMPRNPMRGRLLDRHGLVLATNRLTYRLYIQPQQVSEASWPSLRDRLSRVVGISAIELDRRRREGAVPAAVGEQSVKGRVACRQRRINWLQPARSDALTASCS